jgi:hypothetical protein
MAATGRVLPFPWVWLSVAFEAARAFMREIVRTNDAVLVSAVGALLDGARIHHMVLDQNMSVLEGSLGILPRRVLVAEEDVIRARRLLTEAGLGHELRPDRR